MGSKWEANWQWHLQREQTGTFLFLHHLRIPVLIPFVLVPLLLASYGGCFVRQRRILQVFVLSTLEMESNTSQVASNLWLLHSKLLTKQFNKHGGSFELGLKLEKLAAFPRFDLQRSSCLLNSVRELFPFKFQIYVFVLSLFISIISKPLKLLHVKRHSALNARHCKFAVFYVVNSKSVI